MIMEKINYQDNEVISITKCLHIDGINVGSVNCIKCRHFVHRDTKEKYVLYNFKNNNMKKIEINVPEGYEAVKTEKGYDIVPIKVEKSPDEKLVECMEKIADYNEVRKHRHYISGNGSMSKASNNSDNMLTYNHASENVIRAEQIQMVWRRLAMMYNEGEEWHDRYSVILVEKDKLEPFNNQSSKTERITFRNIQHLYEAIAEIGEENLIFMLKNL